jgi:hypothetical protein
MASPHPLLDQLNDTGYVIIKNLLTEEEIVTLRKACAEIEALGRAGQWEWIRTLPKQVCRVEKHWL